MALILRVIFLTCFALSVAGCQAPKELVGGLSEGEANEILVALDSQKIEADKIEIPGGAGKPTTFKVQVKESEVAKALRILVNNKLPRRKSHGLAQVYPIGKSGLIPTRSEERAKFLMALQGEIENMLMILPGVVQARVAIVLPATDVIRDIDAPPPRSTASVAVVYNPTDEDGNGAVSKSEIKELVASAVEDLNTNDVTILMTVNRPIHLVGEPPSAAAVKAKAEKKEEAPTPLVVADQTETHLSKELKKAKMAQKAAEKKGRLLLMLFGALAVLGLGLGIFGLIRSISLKSKLSSLQQTAISAGAETGETTDLGEEVAQEGEGGEEGVEEEEGPTPPERG